MGSEMERSEPELLQPGDGVDARFRQRWAEWKEERQRLTRAAEERERLLTERLTRQLEEEEAQLREREEVNQRLERELRDVSAKHRQEWRQQAEQLYAATEDNQSAGVRRTGGQRWLRLTLARSSVTDAVGDPLCCIRKLRAAVVALEAELERMRSWPSERSKLEVDLATLTTQHAAEVKEADARHQQAMAAARSARQAARQQCESLQRRVAERERELSQQQEVSDVSERYIAQLKHDMATRDEAIAQHDQAMQQQRQAVRAEQKRCVESLRAMEAELDGYRAVHLGLSTLYEKQLQQVREQLQSVLLYALGMEEETRRRTAGAAAANQHFSVHSSDGGDGITSRKVGHLMSRITQQDALIRSMTRHTTAVKQTPSSSSTGAPAVHRSSSAKSLQRAKVRQHRDGTIEADAAEEDERLRLPLAARVSRLELELVNAEQQLAVQQQRAAESAAQADNAREERDALQQRLLLLQHRLAETSGRHKQQQAGAAALRREAAEAKTAAQLCKQELAGKLQELALSAGRVQELQDDRRLMQERLVQLRLAEELAVTVRKEMQALEASQAQWTEREEAQKRQVEQSEAAVRQLQQELEARERELSDSRQNETAAVSERAVLSASVAALQSQMLERGRELEAARKETAQLQQQIDDLGARSAAAASTAALAAVTWQLPGRDEETAELAARVQRLQQAERTTGLRIDACLRHLPQALLLRVCAQARAAAARQRQRRLLSQSSSTRSSERQQQLEGRTAGDGQQEEQELDLSAVSQAASEVGLNFTALELEELVQACRQQRADAEKQEEEEEEDKGSRAAESALQAFASSFTQDWTAQLLSAPVDERWTAGWCERLTALLVRLIEADARRRLDAEVTPHCEAVDDELLSRYKRVIAE